MYFLQPLVSLFACVLSFLRLRFFLVCLSNNGPTSKGFSVDKGFLLLHAAESESLTLLHELTDSAEYEGFAKKPASETPQSSSAAASEPWLRNRLWNNIQFWRTFCTSTPILSILTVGYHLPWLNGPPQEPHFQKNHPSAFKFPEFVKEVVQQLVLSGAAMEVPFRPFIISPLGVVPKALDKLRLILDLRFVNSFLEIWLPPRGCGP
jgi:hypothetical protein